MTITAFRALLDEIDQQGGPEAARQNRLHIPEERTSQPMNTTPIPARSPATEQHAPEQLSVGALLKWGDEHTDPHVQDQAARARAALVGLRQRHSADRELSAITNEREELEKRLAELQAREAELAPQPKKKRGSYTRDYDTREVRTWAAANGVDCPRVGQIPKRVLDVWRASLPQAG
jgi:hypothetical protein